MSRLLQFTLLIGGASLLVMAATVGWVRRTAPIQWLIYDADGHVVWLNPDTGEQHSGYSMEPGENLYRVFINRGWVTLVIFDVNGNSKAIRVQGDGYEPMTFPHQVQYAIAPVAMQNHGHGTYDIRHSGDVYRLSADGRHLENITNTPTINEQFRTISPDGAWIVYQVGYSDAWDLFRTRRDGSQRQQLTNQLTSYNGLSWSANGEWLYFTTWIDDALYRLRWQTGEIERLVDIGPIGRLEWAKNHEYVILVSSFTGSSDIYRIRPDGRDLNNLTSDWAGDDSLESISPDGEWVIFGSHRAEEGSYDLFRVHIETGRVERLTDLPNSERFRMWSPDGTRLILYEHSLEFQHYYSMNADGTNLRLVSDRNTSAFYGWSPDGEWMFYKADVDNSVAQLFRIRNDGSQEQQLTDTREEAFFVGWSPVIDLHYEKWLLVVLGLASLGGSWCLAYFNSRS